MVRLTVPRNNLGVSTDFFPIHRDFGAPFAVLNCVYRCRSVKSNDGLRFGITVFTFNYYLAVDDVSRFTRNEIQKKTRRGRVVVNRTRRQISTNTVFGNSEIVDDIENGKRFRGENVPAKEIGNRRRPRRYKVERTYRSLSYGHARTVTKHENRIRPSRVRLKRINARTLNNRRFKEFRNERNRINRRFRVT